MNGSCWILWDDDTRTNLSTILWCAWMKETWGGRCAANAILGGGTPIAPSVWLEVER
jgi:hypothetical protein